MTCTGWLFFSECSTSSLWQSIVVFGTELQGTLPTTVCHCWYQNTRVFCYLIVKTAWSHDPIFIRLDRVPACDGRTELPCLILRSALQGMRPLCKNIAACWTTWTSMLFLKGTTEFEVAPVTLSKVHNYALTFCRVSTRILPAVTTCWDAVQSYHRDTSNFIKMVDHEIGRSRRWCETLVIR